LKFSFWKGGASEYCDYESKLIQLDKELMEIRSIIDVEDELEPANTVSREFAFALDVYIIALSDAIKGLSTICQRQCQDRKGLETYSAEQNRSDRYDYDNSIQQYRRLGKRLDQLFKRM